MDPVILKIVHGCSQDVKYLKNDYGLQFRNVFDTEICMSVLNYTKTCYSFCVSHFFHIGIEKENDTMKRYDWGLRPLSNAAIHYAQQDSHFLLKLYHKLKQKIDLNEENEVLNMSETRNLNNMVFVPRKLKMFIHERIYRLENESRKRRGKHRLTFTNAQMERLKLLVEWRFRFGFDNDVNEYSIVPNEVLFTVIKEECSSTQAIEKVFKKQRLRINSLVKNAIQNMVDITLPQRDSFSTTTDCSPVQFMKEQAILTKTSTIRKMFKKLGGDGGGSVSIKMMYEKINEKRIFSGMAFVSYINRKSVETLMTYYATNPIYIDKRPITIKRMLQDVSLEEKLIITKKVQVDLNKPTTTTILIDIFERFGKLKSVNY
ncbi:unnamed protein product [Didymodactylos carnosus]|uniref:3'-5' exonuclease domain-containing protein n=1 Tax=Didymodactylos carnosus TaxID=1234261 RepID=A0A8S2WPT6_9BILA|nr:unnamed protein product [Didymodactylos carnosus]